MRFATELLYLFAVEPGADLDRAAERIGDPAATAAALQPEVLELEDMGRLERLGGGWRSVPQPDPLVVAREALAAVVKEPDGDKMTEIAQAALDRIEPV